MSHAAVTDASRALVKGMYGSALAGDYSGFLGVLDEKLIVHEPSFLPYGGVTHGRDGFTKLFETVCRYLEISTLRLDSIVADGNVVVAFLSAKTIADGSEVSIAERSVVRDGFVVEMRIFYHEGGSLFPRAPR